jgi:hypothetical protein
MNRIFLQTLYILGGVIVLPFLPFLIWQGKRVRKKVGRLPDAAGETLKKPIIFKFSLRTLPLCGKPE